MDLEKLKKMKLLLKELNRDATESSPSASVAEAIMVLIDCVDFIFDSYQTDE